MHPDEHGFISKLRADPRDTLTRWVYADWLKERDDPREDLLRYEEEWVFRCPRDRRYLPEYVASSAAAMRADFEWLRAVSLTAVLMREAWGATHPRFVRRGAAPDPDELPRQAATCIDSLRRVYEKYAPVEWVAERFCVPLDYLAYLLTVGGEWETPEEHEWPGWDYVSGADRLSDAADQDADFETIDSLGGPRSRLPGLWVQVGGRNKHWFFVCCDRTNPYFGALAHAEDTTPSASYEDVFASSFLEFVRSVPTREHAH